MITDEDYFATRADEERSAAEQANDRRAKAAHLELADSYEKLSEAIEEANKPTLARRR